MNHHPSVIIPYYGNWLLTHARMKELYDFAPDGTEIVLVNDASPDLDCHTGVAFWQKQVKRHTIKYVRNTENLGFGGSHNKGARHATGDVLIFLSNDVVIHAPFIEDIDKIIDQYNGEVLVGGRILSHDTGWNTIMLNGKPCSIPYLEGWLIACTKTMWERIGGFDPIYAPYDAEDIDLGAWAAYNDVPMVALNNPKLIHLSGQTIYHVNPQRQEITKRNIIRFKEKWTAKLEEKDAKK